MRGSIAVPATNIKSKRTTLFRTVTKQMFFSNGAALATSALSGLSIRSECTSSDYFLVLWDPCHSVSHSESTRLQAGAMKKALHIGWIAKESGVS